MKAQELAKLLMEYPDYDVEIVYFDALNCTVDSPWSDYRTLVIDDIGDVCESDKIVTLDCYEL